MNVSISRIKNWTNEHKALTTILAILIVVFTWIYEPFKPTNPSNPLFSDRWFAFNDYYFDDAAMADAITKLFPIGTPREYVDLILVQRGKATSAPYSNSKPNDQLVQYSYQPFYMTLVAANWNFYVRFDQQNKVSGLRFQNRVAIGDYQMRKWE